MSRLTRLHEELSGLDPQLQVQICTRKSKVAKKELPDLLSLYDGLTRKQKRQLAQLVDPCDTLEFSRKKQKIMRVSTNEKEEIDELEKETELLINQIDTLDQELFELKRNIREIDPNALGNSGMSENYVMFMEYVRGGYYEIEYLEELMDLNRDH